ncbi:MAG: rod shape-determining protein MreD [Clostridiales bacterium]|nr:rod shape-determining protein MreD [Clostridiales bacterium]
MNGKKYLRLFLYIIADLLCFSLQNTHGMLFGIIGMTPLLTCALAYGVAVYDNVNFALITAAVSGVLSEITLGSVIGPYAILLTAMCFLINRSSNYFDSGALFAVITAVGYSVLACLGVLICFSVQNGINISFEQFVNHGLLRGLYTWLFCVIACMIMKKQPVED